METVEVKQTKPRNEKAIKARKDTSDKLKQITKENPTQAVLEYIKLGRMNIPETLLKRVDDRATLELVKYRKAEFPKKEKVVKPKKEKVVAPVEAK